MTKITYYGHSCFGIEKDGYCLVIDPYDHQTVKGLELPSIQANKVICTHNHSDHNATHCITLVEVEKPSPFQISSIEVPHDDQGGSLRGMNQVYMICTENENLIHFGDIGRELQEDEVEALQGADLIMIPVGGHFTIDAMQAKQIIDQIQPKTAILMHYRTDTVGYDVLAHKDSLKDVFPNVIHLTEHTISLPCEAEVITLIPLQ